MSKVEGYPTIEEQIFLARYRRYPRWKKKVVVWLLSVPVLRLVTLRLIKL